MKIMRNAQGKANTVKKNTREFERLTIAVKRKSDNSNTFVTGLSVSQILHKLGISQIEDFPTKGRYICKNLNENKVVILNLSLRKNVSSVKTSSTSELNKKKKGKVLNIELDRVNNHQNRSKILQPLVARGPGSASKLPRNTTGTNERKKTEFQQPPQTKCNILKKPIEIKKNDFNQFNKINDILIFDPEPVKEVENESESRICVIEKVFGNAVASFSSGDDVPFYDDEDVICLDSKESQLIVPRKTDDITKIKGWRRKQFFVEKPTTVEFEEIMCGNGVHDEVPMEQDFSAANDVVSSSHVENAFVCESLDEFLEQEAELKVNYEIPHLFAEVGIKLTKEEIASGPSLSDQDIKEVETKYCKPVPNHFDIINLDDIKTEELETEERYNEDDGEEPLKTIKLENSSEIDTGFLSPVKNSTVQKINYYNNILPKKTEDLKEKNLNRTKIGFESFRRTANFRNVKLTSKVLGLVVYPAPNRPLHPIVQFHLRKLRAYHTIVDSNWANFAASALVNKDSKYGRFILPTTCCVKLVENPVSFVRKNTNVTPSAVVTKTTQDVPPPVKEDKKTKEPKEDQSSFSRLSNKKKFSTEDLKAMMNCKVVLKKLDVLPGDTVCWCARHNCLNCKTCTSFKIPNPVLSSAASYKGRMDQDGKNIKKRKYEESVLISSQPGFDEDLANLLAKRLKVFHPDSLTSIDSLKTLKINAVELIKLKFIQKSFMHKYISIWYVKPNKANVRFRAFLTFTKTPPVPNAISLRYGLLVNNLPKVIREILYAEKCVDPNEYVLLYCNGSFWEIHGSVNVAFNKSIKSTEEVMIPSELPELQNLRVVSLKTLKVKCVKWWVFDLSQKFQVIEMKSENVAVNISQEKLLKFVKVYSYGFMPLKTNSDGRVFGAYVHPSLLPYVLIGPYYVFEIRNTKLRGDFSTIPFMYNEVEDTTESSCLKSHISHTIKKTKESGKTLEGLWLHHKTFGDHSCFLQVIATSLATLTTLGVNPSSRSYYNVHDEHGYSLNSSLALEEEKKSVKSQDKNLKVEVYLYFDIFGLGYVLGVLEKDNSVTIRHPLNERTKVNSSEIGSWFLGTIRGKIQFVPKNLIVNWYITKNKSQLQNRQPFNKNFLNGAYILTDSGVFYVLKIAEPSSQNSIRKRRKTLEPAHKRIVIEELVYLKLLSNVLVENSNIRLSLNKVLSMALEEITKLQKKLNLLERVKACLEEEKLRLFSSYLITIHLKGLNINLSVKLLKKIEKLFFNENGKIREAYAKKLNLYNFGRHYLKTIEKEKLLNLETKPS